jgi:hypothetical protein
VASCSVLSGYYPTVNIKLESADTLRSGDKIDVSYIFNSVEVKETLTLVDTFTSSAVLPYQFTTPFSITSDGNYSIEASVKMDNEVETGNNSFVQNFKVGTDKVDLGADIVTYDDIVTLDAGAGFVSYLWNDNSTMQKLAVSNSGEYSVETEDVNLCKSSDTINVIMLNPVYRITEIIGLKDTCEHSDAETVSFVIKNAGNDTIFKDSIVHISYKVNANEEIKESYTFENNLTPKDSAIIDFTKKADLSEVNSYTIEVSAVVGDKIMLDTVVDTWGFSEVDLGKDIVTTEISTILDAGSDGSFQTYLWSTGETTQAITVTTDGTYWVKVFNVHSCMSVDTVNVKFLPYYLEINNLISPLYGCGSLEDAKVSVRLQNSGTQAIPAGADITLGYIIGEDTVRESVPFSNPIPVNKIFTYNYSNKITNKEPGIYKIKLFTKYVDDYMDTLSYVINIYEKPVFFGGQDTVRGVSFPYEIDSKITNAESYLWSTGETTPKITVNNKAIYSLTIKQDNECYFTDSIYVTDVIGITDTWSKGISVYPNPSDREINITLPENARNVTLQVVNVDGRIVYNKKNINGDYTINVSNWNQGIYTLQIFDDEHFGIYQLIKK